MAITEIKEKYHFNDLYVFCKIANGNYISLSDFEFGFNSALSLKNSESKFIIGVQGHTGYFITDITLEELMLIAGVTPNTNFVKQCRYGIEPELADELLATICAKKIMNLPYGVVKLDNETDTLTYNFIKRKFVNGKRVYIPIVKKVFRKG